MRYPLCHAALISMLAPLALCSPPALSEAPRLTAASGATPSEAQSPVATELAAPPDVASYDLGLMLGNQLGHSGLEQEVAIDALVRGLKDALGGTPITAEQRDSATQFMRHGRETLIARNRSIAKEFLAANAQAQGVTTTASGLQYRVLSAGEPGGSHPGPSDQVTVNYRAALADHTEFDNSYARGRPASFQMSGVIKGLHEALTMMTPGAKWQVFVPPELAFGATPPPTIPPGSMLIYELELLKTEPVQPRDPNLVRPTAGTGATPAAVATARARQ